MILELVQENFVAVVITSLLMLFVMTNNNFEKRTNRLFLAASLCILILIVEEAWEARLALSETFTPLRTVLSAIGYSLRPLIPYFMIILSRRYSRTRFILLTLPLAFNTLVAFSALFCGVSFGYTSGNKFVRGPLGFTPFLVAGFYVIILLILTIQSGRKGGLMEGMTVSAMVLIAFLSTVMESQFHLQFIQNPCMATSITFYYLFLHSNQNNRDPLTGAMVRRRFYFDATKHAASLSAVVSLDLNNLKLLNDQYGHVEGDTALITVTDIIKRHMGAHASLYRVGGDEFAILCYKMSVAKIERMLTTIRAELAQTKYRCAIGYALYADRMNLDEVCHLADHAMYEDKRRLKSLCEQGEHTL